MDDRDRRILESAVDELIGLVRRTDVLQDNLAQLSGDIELHDMLIRLDLLKNQLRSLRREVQTLTGERHAQDHH